MESGCLHNTLEGAIVNEHPSSHNIRLTGRNSFIALDSLVFVDDQIEQCNIGTLSVSFCLCLIHSSFIHFYVSQRRDPLLSALVSWFYNVSLTPHKLYIPLLLFLETILTYAKGNRIFGWLTKDSLSFLSSKGQMKSKCGGLHPTDNTWAVDVGGSCIPGQPGS